LKIETKAVNVTPTGCVIQFIGRGTFSGDVRTFRRASGKTFAYQSCLVLDINDEGLVTKVEEYYSFLHGEGVEVEKYHQVKVMDTKM
jgi:hypothetical protein